MKKYLNYMLLLVAALVSVTTLVSCGDDGFEAKPTTNKYTFTFDVNTKNVEVAENSVFQEKVAEIKTTMLAKMKKEYILDDQRAAIEWGAIELDSEYISTVQNTLDLLANAFDDKTMTCTLRMLKNGKDWKSKSWSARPILWI